MFRQNVYDYFEGLGYRTDKFPSSFSVGKRYRLPALGKNSKNTSLSIELKPDGTYLWHDFATDDSGAFNPDWHKQVAQDKAEVERKQAERERTAKAEEAKKLSLYEQKAFEAQQIWTTALPCESHPYMDVAGISPVGAKTLPYVHAKNDNRYNNPLIIERRDARTNAVVNLQFIMPDGTKRPLKGAQSDYTYFKIKGDSSKPTIFVEGYKDACNAYHATGQSVVCCFTADGLKKVYPIMAKPGDFIISDNDNKPKLNDDNTRKAIIDRKTLLTYGKGHKTAHEMGAKFYLCPELGADAGSMSHAEIKQLLSQKPTSDLPVYDAWTQLRGQPCDTETKNLLGYLLDETDPFTCAVYCYQYAFRHIAHIPHKLNILELRAAIEVAAAGKVHPVTLDNILLAVQFVLDKLHAKCLLDVTIQDAKGHKVTRIEDFLEFKPDVYHGVYLVKAPTGTGKTQKVGRPFREWCELNGHTFLSIAHLRSLIREMSSSKALNTAHYEDEKKAAKQAHKDGNYEQLEFSQDALSVCLPSLNNPHFAKFIKYCRYVFIDEITQVLEAFSSREMFSHTDVKAVYDLLRLIIARAECVIVADANISQHTLDFIESCRPAHECLNIIEIAPKDEGKTAHLYDSHEQLQKHILSQVMTENKNVWITCDSEAAVITLRQIFRDLDVSVIGLIGREQDKAEHKLFLSDPDKHSRNYQVVISTSVISSGVSVEHRDSDGVTQPHFDFVAGFFKGRTVQPMDAYQMLGRVRYATDIHIFATQNKGTVLDAETVINGKLQASLLEGVQAEATEFTKYREQLEQIRAERTTNFANSLVWLLNAKKFQLKRMQPCDASYDAELFKATKEQVAKEQQEAIKGAYKITDDMAHQLRRKGTLSDAELYALQAYELRSRLGLPNDAELTDAHLDIDLGQLIRFNAIMGRYRKSTDTHKDVALRRYAEATGKAYRLAFDGVQFKPNATYTEASAVAIMEQVAKYRILLAAIGAIPARYGLKSWKPSKYPCRELSEILKHFGLKTKYKRNPFKPHLKRELSVEMPPFLYINIAVSQQINDSYAYSLEPDQFAFMQQLSDSIFEVPKQAIQFDELQEVASTIIQMSPIELDQIQPEAVQIDEPPQPTNATNATIETAPVELQQRDPVNDGEYLDVIAELQRSDLTLMDLYKLKYFEQSKQRTTAHSSGSVQLEYTSLDLINALIKVRHDAGQIA